MNGGAIMKLYEGGVYLVNGHDIVEENSMTQPVSREEAAKNTMAYGHVLPFSIYKKKN